MVRRWTSKLGRGVMAMLLAAGLFIGAGTGTSAAAMIGYTYSWTAYQTIWQTFALDGLEEEDTLTGTGRYVGMADPHTIEVIVKDEAYAFQVGDDLRATVEKLEEDDRVVFEYTEEPLDEIAILRTLLSIKVVDQE